MQRSMRHARETPCPSHCLRATAGGTACQMMEDQCQPVPEAALCDAWTQRVREFESATVFATASRPTPAEGERIRRVLADSTCTP